MTVTKSAYARKDFELYETEAWATECLQQELQLDPGRIIWEPSAGRHKIADVFRRHGHKVITSDITIHGRPHHFVADFFTEFDVPDFKDLMTNPPYGHQNRLAAKYARKALDICDGWVALLLTAKFDFGLTRTDLFRDNPRFHSKICLLDRIQWFEGPDVGTEDHAWYVWCPVAQAGRQPAQIKYAHNQAKKSLTILAV